MLYRYGGFLFPKKVRIGESEMRIKMVSLALALALVLGMAFGGFGTKEVCVQSASAGANDQENLSEDVEDTIYTWIPTIVTLMMIGVALGALGVNLTRRMQQ
jgi:hypothetical protein